MRAKTLDVMVRFLEIVSRTAYDTKKPGKPYDSVAVSNDDIVNEMIDAIEKNEPDKMGAWIDILEIGTKLRLYARTKLIDETEDGWKIDALEDAYSDDYTGEED